MKAPAFLIGAALAAAIVLVMAPNPVLAQDPNPDGTRADVRRPAHDSKGSKDVDFATARADADARAKARQDTDVDVKNKQNQKQTAVGVGIGGGAKVDVKNRNTNTNTSLNVNTLKTGDVINYNVNDNKQIQSFGIPSRKAVEPTLR